VAATNMKQRTRKQIEYYHADRLNYAVAGTPNRLEYDQGFFVKNGDGAADIKPIAHLYKTQVYQLAAHLGVPEEIRRRPPTTDTWSLAQTQDEFYFSLPYDRMDLCLYGLDHGVPAAAVGRAANLSEDQVERVWRDIHAKRKATRYLHEPPLLVESACNQITCRRTRATPAPVMRNARAALVDTSMVRPRMNGPRSLMRTTTELPFDRLVTRTRVPNGRVRCAAVMPRAL